MLNQHRINEKKPKDPGFDPLPRQTLKKLVRLIFESKTRNYTNVYRVTSSGVNRQRQTQIKKRPACKRLDMLADFV